MKQEENFKNCSIVLTMNCKSSIHFFYLVRNFSCLFEAFRMIHHADVTFSGVEKRVFQGDNKCSECSKYNWKNTITINYILFIYWFVYETNSEELFLIKSRYIFFRIEFLFLLFLLFYYYSSLAFNFFKKIHIFEYSILWKFDIRSSIHSIFDIWAWKYFLNAFKYNWINFENFETLRRKKIFESAYRPSTFFKIVEIFLPFDLD